MKIRKLLFTCLTIFGLMTSAYAGPSHSHNNNKQPPTPSISQNQPINLNTSDAKTLAEQIDGIGIGRAKAIVAYRDAHGRFQTLEDLAKVKGISAHILQKHHAQWQKYFITE